MVVGLGFLTRLRRFATSILWGGVLVLGLLGFKAMPQAWLGSLENQFNVPSLTSSDPYAGVIVLGGAMDNPAIYKAHGQIPLGDAAERMTVPIDLMRKFPNFELIFFGGEGRLVPTGTTEAELAKVFFNEQGVDMKRVTLQSQAKTSS